NDGMISWNFRGLRVVSHEPHLRRVQLHPGILRRRLRYPFHQAAFDAFVVLTRDRTHAAPQQAVDRKCARIISGREASDDARKRIEGVRIQRMRYRRDPLGLEIGDRLHNLVAEIDAADALVALLNTRGLAVNLDLEPDAADARGLHREVAGFA